MTDHPSRDVLADASEGLLTPADEAGVDAHLAGCAECRAELESLADVRRVLVGAPALSMPAAVADRLRAVIADEQAAREVSPVLSVVPGSGPDAPPVPRHPYGTQRRLHPSLGTFGADLRRRPVGRRWALPVLAAAAAAVLLGFGAYVASATVGFNEPPVVSIAPAPSKLGPQASALRERTDLDPHRFTPAWWCARRATTGRIVGLASTSTPDGPAVLTYLRTDDRTVVVLVTGCDSADPSATAPVPITE